MQSLITTGQIEAETPSNIVKHAMNACHGLELYQVQVTIKIINDHIRQIQLLDTDCSNGISGGKHMPNCDGPGDILYNYISYSKDLNNSNGE